LKSVYYSGFNNYKIIAILELALIIIFFIFYHLHILEDLKISIFNLIYHDNKEKVNYINGKLLWNNESSFDIIKISKEIREYDNLVLSFENKKDFKKRKYPFISLVITLFNQEKYIKYIYASIQKQKLKDIEIIFINDGSGDNSEKIIKYLMNKDKRIVYLNNKINRKAFYSRYKGILNSKGKYIMAIDPDDLLINNILLKTYITAEKYNLDIVEFYMISAHNYHSKLFLNSQYKYVDGILKGNSEVRKLFYYGISRNIADKLVKRDTYIKSINFMKKEFYYEDYHINDDDTAFFNLIHVAESYGFLEQIGYFYTAKYSSTVKKKYIKETNKIYSSFCNIMKYFYFQSDNNILEKRNICYNYFKKSIRSFGYLINHLNKGFDFIIDILNLYINSTFLSVKQKNEIKNFKKKIIKRKKIVVNTN